MKHGVGRGQERHRRWPVREAPGLPETEHRKAVSFVPTSTSPGMAGPDPSSWDPLSRQRKTSPSLGYWRTHTGRRQARDKPGSSPRPPWSPTDSLTPFLGFSETGPQTHYAVEGDPDFLPPPFERRRGYDTGADDWSPAPKVEPLLTALLSFTKDL